MTASIAYGVLQLIVNPYIISLPQMFLDYIFAFGALGLSGIFANSRNGWLKVIRGELLEDSSSHSIVLDILCGVYTGILF